MHTNSTQKFMTAKCYEVSMHLKAKIVRYSISYLQIIHAFFFVVIAVCKSWSSRREWILETSRRVHLVHLHVLIHTMHATWKSPRPGQHASGHVILDHMDGVWLSVQECKGLSISALSEWTSTSSDRSWTNVDEITKEDLKSKTIFDYQKVLKLL